MKMRSKLRDILAQNRRNVMGQVFGCRVGVPGYHPVDVGASPNVIIPAFRPYRRLLNRTVCNIASLSGGSVSSMWPYPGTRRIHESSDHPGGSGSWFRIPNADPPTLMWILSRETRIRHSGSAKPHGGITTRIHKF